MKTNHKIIIGDSRRMNSVDDQSVHLVITSPPYWQIKNYGNGRQIGYGNSYEEYINNLNLVWQKTYRILKPACRLCINIGDQFARAADYGRYKVIPIRTEIIKFCEILGFDYMGAVIWRKITNTNTTGGAVIMGSYPFPRNGILKIDYEFILIFKKDGNPEPAEKEVKEQSRLTAEEWNTYFSGHWNFPGEKQIKHLATFPLELPIRLIKMFSFVGDMVLDPFLGSGTTSLAAMDLKRNSIGYEINDEYLPLIRDKLDNHKQNIINDADIQYDRDQISCIDFDNEIKVLPYIFKDPHKLYHKKDIAENSYGTKIDHREKKDIQYFSVKKAIAPDLVYLSNNKKLKLLGIRINPDKQKEALKYLEEITLSQKVTVKFDHIKYDKDNILMGYLYLKNKTFINAKLIKKGLVVTDDIVNHKYKNRFRRYEKQALGERSD